MPGPGETAVREVEADAGRDEVPPREEGREEEESVRTWRRKGFLPCAVEGRGVRGGASWVASSMAANAAAMPRAISVCGAAVFLSALMATALPMASSAGVAGLSASGVGVVTHSVIRLRWSCDRRS